MLLAEGMERPSDSAGTTDQIPVCRSRVSKVLMTDCLSLSVLPAKSMGTDWDVPGLVKRVRPGFILKS